MSHNHTPTMKSTKSDSFSAKSNSERWEQNNQNQIAQQPIHKNILLDILHNFAKDNTHSEIDQKEPIKNHHNVSFNQQEDLNHIPEPIQSQEDLSREAQYFSYLEVFLPKDESQIESLDENLTLRQKIIGVARKEFLSLLYKCVTYVRKDRTRTQIDDQLLSEVLEEHLVIKVLPEAKSIIGSALMVNGYALTAFAILFARINKSPYLLRYILDEFYKNLNKIQENKDEFLYYFGKDVQFFGVQNNLSIQECVNFNAFRKSQVEKTISSQKLDRNIRTGSIKRTHLPHRDDYEKQNDNMAKNQNLMLETRVSIDQPNISRKKNNQFSPKF